MGGNTIETEQYEKILTCGRFYREFADTRGVGCAGARCKSLKAKKRFGDSRVRKTRVLRLMVGPLQKLTMKVGQQLLEIEWTEIEYRYERKKCGSCHYRSKAAAGGRHR